MLLFGLPDNVDVQSWPGMKEQNDEDCECYYSKGGRP